MKLKEILDTISCNFSVNGICRRVENNDVRCNGLNEKAGCPYWGLIKLTD